MNDSRKEGELILGVHPTAYGFGWVLFEGPRPVDWGIASAQAKRDRKLLRRFERLLKRYEPDSIVMETFDERSSTRGDRIRRLCAELLAIARLSGASARLYRRELVQRTFAHAGATTRYGIAEVIREHIAVFSHRMPRRRRIWQNDDRRQSLFDAAAVVLTHLAMMEIEFTSGAP